MSTIYVRTKPGRIARESPTGPYIPHDKYVPVRPTSYINRLLHVHGDIERYVQTAPVAKPKKSDTE